MQNELPYSEAIVNKFPEQVVIGIARDANGMCNPIALGWTMITSGSPPMMAVAIGQTRYSLEVFRHAKEFVVALPSEAQAEETMLFGTKSGRDIDKLAEADAQIESAKAIDCVLLSEAVANFECTLVKEVETGDHFLFVGEVVRSHASGDRPNRLYTVGPGHQLAGLARSGR